MTAAVSNPTVWPDTTKADPPADHLYGAALWLLGRHPELSALADRIPGVVEHDLEGPFLALDTLVETIRFHDADAAAWADYEASHVAPEDAETHQMWLDAGPQAGPAVEAMARLTGTQRTQLRLLAAFAHGRVPFSVSDLRPLDREGHHLIVDWCLAAQAF